jgi:hypothetical protein
MGSEVVPDFGVRQGVHTERLGVVSRQAGVFKVAGDVEEKH